jgi:arsenite methyltransferase
MTTVTAVDRKELEARVKDMYRRVALEPEASFHFEMGRPLAERLGYAPDDLDRVPAEAIASFAGVGHHFDLAELAEGEAVVDFGSGAGMDSFVAALTVGPTGRVTGVDMTDEQRAKATRLAEADGFSGVRFVKGYIEDVPLADACADAVISNGVINLSADKASVFREAARVLRPGGRLALSDIVTECPLPESVVCDPALWAACIGGAAQQTDYCALIEAAGLRLRVLRHNTAYRFLSDNARGACERFRVKSISLLAEKESG